MSQAITCSLVPRSGAGMSISGPITLMISIVKRLVTRCSSARESSIGSTRTPPFAPPNGKTDDRAFPGHQHGEGGDLAEVDVGGEPDPAFGRAHGGEVLDPVTEEGLHLRIGVPSEREAHHGRLLRDTEAVGDVVVQPHEPGHPVELAGGLLVHR